MTIFDRSYKFWFLDAILLFFIVLLCFLAGYSASDNWDKRVYPDHLKNQDDRVIYEFKERKLLFRDPETGAEVWVPICGARETGGEHGR